MSQPDDEELLLGRLREATSGESSVRQLRRRYDLLRRDYEVLLDRLAELEERFGTSPQFEPASAFAAENPAPVAQQGAARGSLVDQVRAPLLQLREEYREAFAAVQAIVSGLDAIAGGTMKGQRASSDPEAEPAGHERGAESAAANRPERVHVEVSGSGFGGLLDFQERLANLEGVARVSIQAIDSEQATFTVELED